MCLDDSKFSYVHHSKIAKEMWDTLAMIYGVSPSIEQEEINTRGEEIKMSLSNGFKILEILETLLECLSLTNV